MAADLSKELTINLAKSLDVIVAPSFITVNLKALLYGAVTGTDTMRTSLRSKSYFPLTQPFSGAPWNYTGPEAVTSVPADVVDWVLIEIRTNATTIINRRACFIMSNGLIKDLNGINPPKFNLPAQNYYVVIKHINHLSIMTSTAIALSANTPLYDFTLTANSAYGTTPNQLLYSISGQYCMILGDVNRNGTARTTGAATVNDVTMINNYIIGGPKNEYSSYDTNRDGIVNTDDATLVSSTLSTITYTTKVVG